MKFKNRFLGRLFAGLMAVAMLTTINPETAFVAEAVTKGVPYETSVNKPYAKIQYAYSAGVTPGTIRYISQTGLNFYDNRYWGSISSKNECGTCCHSMALSYLGANMTPEKLLIAGGRNADGTYRSRLGTPFVSGITGGYDHQGSGCTSAALTTALNNYLANNPTNPKYSPVFVHVPNYPPAGHYLLIIGRMPNENSAYTYYECLDPWDNDVTTIMLSKSNPVNVMFKNPTFGSTGYIYDTIDEFFQFTKTSGAVISPAPSTPANTGEKITAVTEKAGIILDDDISVRSGAGTTFARLGYVDKYTKVTVTGQSTNWYRVKVVLNGTTKTAYIHKNYVGIGTRPATVSFKVKRYYGKRMQISWTKQSGVSGYMIKRYNPSTKKYVTLKTISNNTTTSFMDTGLTSGVTYRYRVYSYKSFKTDQVYKIYSPLPTSIGRTAYSYMYGYTTGTDVNVRKGAGTSYGILKRIKSKDASVRVYGATGDWYKVQVTVNGVKKYGYIQKSFLRL